MEVYPRGTAISLRSSEYLHEAAQLQSWTETHALVHRADVLHSNHADGFDPRAHRLHVKGCKRALYHAASGGLILAVWVRLSDGSKLRAAWHRKAQVAALFDLWERVPWCFGKRAPVGRHKATS
jgi:hypothetical protein